MNVLVVLPTYNEAENIDHVLRRVRSSLADATVLVVDDGSPDGTAALAETIGKELGSIEILRRHDKSGLGSAYRAGFRWGLDHGFDACIEMDADLSHEPEALPELVAPLSEGYELVIGSRYVAGGSIPNWTWHRRMLSRGGNIYASALLGLGVADSTDGFRAYSASVLQRIALVDVMLPDVDGLEVCRRLRAEQISTPVLFLTARDATADKVAGLALGDDYVTKPFSIDELVARIHAVMRRGTLEEDADQAILRFRDLVVDVRTHQVWRGNQPIELTPTEFNLLLHLLRNARQVLSKTQILDAVWDEGFIGESNIVEIYISYLRKKIDCFDPPLIHTIRGVGYSLREAQQ